MNQFDIARRLLRVHEGLRPDEYMDTTGHRTIGYGWNLDAKPLPFGVGSKLKNGRWRISQAEADALLDVSMRTHWQELVQALPWVEAGNIDDLNKWRQAALLDMAFNLGIPRLMTFRNSLALMRAGRWDEAGRRVLKSLWASQVKRRADVLSTVLRTGWLPAPLWPAYGFGTVPEGGGRD